MNAAFSPHIPRNGAKKLIPKGAQLRAVRRRYGVARLHSSLFSPREAFLQVLEGQPRLLRGKGLLQFGKAHFCRRY